MSRHVWPWLRLLMGVALLAIPVWRVGPEAFVAGFRLIDGTALVAALTIGLLTIVLSACRWCLVARRLGLRLPLPTAIGDYYRGQFLNSVLPIGVLGDADRAVRHGRESGDLGRGVRAVVFERFGSQIVLIAASVVVLGVGSTSVARLATEVLPGAAIMLAAVAGLVAVIALAAWAWRGKASARLRTTLAVSWTDARRGLLARDTFPAVLVLSAAALAGHLCLFLVAARTAGATAPVTQLLPLLVLALLAMGLPLNVGGWGPREAFTALAFGAVGLGAALGLTVAVTYGVLAFVSSLPGLAMVMLRRTSLSWPTLRRPRPRPQPSPRNVNHYLLCSGRPAPPQNLARRPTDFCRREMGKYLQ